MRKTKIICTLGPAVDSDERITQIINAGMDCARLNFSHGTHEEQEVRLNRVRRIAGSLTGIFLYFLIPKDRKSDLRILKMVPLLLKKEVYSLLILIKRLREPRKE